MVSEGRQIISVRSTGLITARLVSLKHRDGRSLEYLIKCAFDAAHSSDPNASSAQVKAPIDEMLEVENKAMNRNRADTRLEKFFFKPGKRCNLRRDTPIARRRPLANEGAL